MDKAASNKVEEQTLLKLTLVGDEQVGKTCLATRII
jgi:GTPase SAR1 family protein